MPNTIARAEAFEFEWQIERKDRYTGALNPIDEDSAVSAWLSLTFKGDPVTPGSVVPLTRRDLELRSDGRVLWFGILEATDVTAALVGITTGNPVYEVCEIDGERKSRQLTVAD
jgi:hypothetical protein